MKKLFRLIVLVLLLAGWTVAAMSLHVIRGQGRVVVVPKKSLDYHDIYVDTTKWTLDDVARHPAVVNRLIQNGKAVTVWPKDSAEGPLTWPGVA